MVEYETTEEEEGREEEVEKEMEGMEEYVEEADEGELLVLRRTLSGHKDANHAKQMENIFHTQCTICLLYTSPSPRDGLLSRMPSSA